MRRRAVPVAAGIAAAATLLTACQKPAPKVTVLGGGKVVNLSASSYCFDAKHCRAPGLRDLPVLSVAADDKVLIDVPRQVAGRGWQVRALDLPSGGQKALGTSPTMKGNHTYKVASGAASGDPFIVEVDQLAKGKPDGSKWSFIVRVSPTK